MIRTYRRFYVSVICRFVPRHCFCFPIFVSSSFGIVLWRIKSICMVSRFDNILEHWAQIYRPLSHNPEKGSKAKSFYRIDTINTQNEFVRNVNTATSPALAYSSLIDAELHDSLKTVHYRHTLYFLAKQPQVSLAKSAKQDDDNAAALKVEMDEWVNDLLVWLFSVRRMGKCPITGKVFSDVDLQALRGLDLDNASWATIPMMYNGWWVLGLELNQVSPRKQCIENERYKKLL